jgi:hypothetical protein
VMASHLGPAIDVRTTFRRERDLLIRLLNKLDELEWTARCVLADLCAMLPRTGYMTTFADSVTAATIVPNAGESMPSFLNRANDRWVEERRFVSPRHFAELF